MQANSVPERSWTAQVASAPFDERSRLEREPLPSSRRVEMVWGGGEPSVAKDESSGGVLPIRGLAFEFRGLSPQSRRQTPPSRGLRWPARPVWSSGNCPLEGLFCTPYGTTLELPVRLSRPTTGAGAARS